MNDSPKIRLIGGLQTKGYDWSLEDFGCLFGRLSGEVDHTGDLIRYVRYEGFTDGQCEVRFFGAEVESIESIPEGMIALDLCGNTFTVYEPKDGKKEILRQSGLAWNWFTRQENGRWIGEFTAECPSGWNRTNIKTGCEFQITASAYSARGKDCDDDVSLVDYNPAWPGLYDEMSQKLRNLLGPNIALRIEHYGSTAIPGMPAKPIIDILVEIPSFDAARKQAIPILSSPECEYWFYSGHMVFIVRKELMGQRTHHIHMAPAGNELWQGLVFRDYLRSSPDDAAHYRALKYKLARRYRTDRERYTTAKGDFVREVTERAIREENRP